MMKRKRQEGRYFSLFETGRGFGGVVASDRGLVEVFMPEDGRGRGETAGAICALYPLATGENGATRQAAELLARYFRGEEVLFDLPVDERVFTPFQLEICRVVSRIPYGRVMSYREVATAAGRPRAARGVGNAMGGNPLPIVIPCHRVVGAGGALTGYSAPGGVETKEELLIMEGVAMRGTRRAAMPETM